jgi:subtilisin family serine protease
VSGIIAGRHYGVAKKAKLVSVQVLDKNGKGSMSNLIAGIDWVAKHAKRGKSVVNLSLGVAKNTPGANALNQGTSITFGLMISTSSEPFINSYINTLQR